MRDLGRWISVPGRDSGTFYLLIQVDLFKRQIGNSFLANMLAPLKAVVVFRDAITLVFFGQVQHLEHQHFSNKNRKRSRRLLGTTELENKYI
ncbi:hypothetical protein DPEC_G00088570 [Dallia pectoralis]|uniref:Uncharacterized protein n=1 Tax=Dallia pectoralis TaxID=75939 RepID=A0ACC2H0K9_DALPE|nr:hypothetical protein DPEC_G00088570 [Dallia pectoralis]